jgi:hypothetical protein
MSPEEWLGSAHDRNQSERGVITAGPARADRRHLWVGRCSGAQGSVERVVGECELLDLRVSSHGGSERDLDAVHVGVELPELVDDFTRDAPRFLDLHIHAEHHQDDGVIAIAMAYRREARPGLPRLPSARLHLKQLLSDSDIPSRLDEGTADAAIMPSDHLFRNIADWAVVGANNSAVVEQLKALSPHLEQLAIRERAEIEQRPYVRRRRRAVEQASWTDPEGQVARLFPCPRD